MLNRFTKFIEENRLAGRDDNILMAVSGGIDSMVMASLFVRAGYKTGIAHCNFSLRGREADLDQELVQRFAEEHQLNFSTIRFNTREYAALKGISIQMAARELRYEWFEKIRSENAYTLIAVAHNLNDNIETLLINLTRGTGIAGLTGIKARAGNIIRPILFAKRSEIEECCRDSAIVYREDRSNAETKYFRNKIRHMIIPVMKELNPSVEDTLAETISRLTGIRELAEERTESIRSLISEESNGSVSFAIDDLERLKENTALIYELFRPFGTADIPVSDLLNVISGKTGGRIISSTHTILKDRDRLITRPLEESDSNRTESFRDTDELARSGLFSEVAVSPYSRGTVIPASQDIHSLDADLLSFPVKIRQWQKGDYFYPIGMKGRKKLSDYFTDHKYSLFDKEAALVLESGGRIAAILGERTDDRFRISSSTKRVLTLAFRR